jgi:hypothetical protein
MGLRHEPALIGKLSPSNSWSAASNTNAVSGSLSLERLQSKVPVHRGRALSLQSFIRKLDFSKVLGECTQWHQPGPACGACEGRSVCDFSVRRPVVTPRSRALDATCGPCSHEHRRRADCRRGVVGSRPLLVKPLRRSRKRGRNLTSPRSAGAHRVEWSAQEGLREARRGRGPCSALDEARRCANECVSMWYVRQVARRSRKIAICHAPLLGARLTASSWTFGWLAT